MAVCQNLVPLVNIKIAGKWMFIPLKMVLIGIDPYPYELQTWRLKMEILQQEAPCTMEFARSSVWGWIKIKQQVVHHVEELHHEDPEKSQFP